jgi:hypothetical protein
VRCVVEGQSRSNEVMEERGGEMMGREMWPVKE